MKKILFILMSIMFVSSMLFVGIGCKEEVTETVAEEATEEVMEEADEVAEEATEEVTEEEADEPYTIALVVKLEGIAWFDNTRVGIQQFAKDFGVDAYQIGAADGDPAKQVALVEDLIAKNVDAILVIPNDGASMVPVFNKAAEAGIPVLTHETAGIENALYDLEPFRDEQYGEAILAKMAEKMNYEGEWASFVATLTHKNHVAWADAGAAVAAEKYPNMTLVADKIEDQVDEQIAYEKTLELLKAYPELKGVFCTSMTNTPGVSRALKEKGLDTIVAVSGSTLPSVAAEYLLDDTVTSIVFWSPADVAYALAYVALQVLEGNDISEGMSLMKAGYENITIVPNGSGVPVLYGQGWQTVTKENLSDWQNDEGGYDL